MPGPEPARREIGGEFFVPQSRDHQPWRGASWGSLVAPRRMPACALPAHRGYLRAALCRLGYVLGQGRATPLN